LQGRLAIASSPRADEGTLREHELVGTRLAASAKVEAAQHVLVEVDAEAWPRGDDDVPVDDGDLLRGDLLAVLEGSHHVGRVGEVRQPMEFELSERHWPQGHGS
jgi:hypothetical protein